MSPLKIPTAAAQCADELLTIKDVNMSFVLVRNKEYINISGRSVGDMNVQVILERLEEEAI